MRLDYRAVPHYGALGGSVDPQKTSLRIPRELHEGLRRAAEAESRTLSAQLCVYLRECLARDGHLGGGR